MTPSERKAFRPTTVKNNIIGAIKCIRATRRSLESFNNPSQKIIEAHEGQIRDCERIIRDRWLERKSNNWIN